MCCSLQYVSLCDIEIPANVYTSESIKDIDEIDKVLLHVCSTCHFVKVLSHGIYPYR